MLNKRRLKTALAIALMAASALVQLRADVPPKRIDYDMGILAASRTGSEMEGQRLFVQRCALCHVGAPTEVPFGAWINRQRLDALGKIAVREKIMNGSERMPGWKYTLTAKQIDKIVAYLESVTTTKVPEDPPAKMLDSRER